MSIPITPLPPAQDQAQSNEPLNTLPVCLQQNQLNKGKASLCSEPFPAPHVSLPRPSPLYLCPLAPVQPAEGSGQGASSPSSEGLTCIILSDRLHLPCAPPHSKQRRSHRHPGYPSPKETHILYTTLRFRVRPTVGSKTTFKFESKLKRCPK